MKKFAINALAIAAGALSVGGALAGTITLPGGAHTFAVEGLAPTTAVTTPNIVYNMGVGRPIGNGFTIIVAAGAGSTFGATCVIPVYAGPSTVSVTLKRSGIDPVTTLSNCVYDVQVAGLAVTVGDTFTWTGQQYAAHPLAVKGNTISVSINLKDPGETAQVDNPGPISSTIASSAQAINVYSTISDTFTVADVNATGGPLTGFVPDANAPSDSATQARAHLRFDHNSANRLNPDGVTLYTFSGTTALTLTGSTSGVATNGFCLNADNDANMCEVGERFTVTPSAATFANATPAFGGQGSSVDRDVTFVADGTTQLGTARTFALSGTITPQLAGASANSLADTNGKNATAWVWSANASQLVTPYFTTSALFLSRVFFLNTGAAPVGYTATCFSETGNTITYGAAKTGLLSANGQTAVNLKNVCSFADAGLTRGSVLFTINAPISTVKGSYQQVDPVSLNNAIVPLSRPYNQANTTE